MNLSSVRLNVIGNTSVTRGLNVLLPLVGIALMVVYEYCDTSCSYLRGTFFGVDLKWVGIIYMGVLFFSACVGGWPSAYVVGHLRTILISAAVGVELFLIAWQIVKDTYCPFCLAFSVCIFILFGINVRFMNKGMMVAALLAGLLLFTLFFEGQAAPRFDL